jgi:hypothetical protein
VCVQLDVGFLALDELLLLLLPTLHRLVKDLLSQLFLQLGPLLLALDLLLLQKPFLLLKPLDVVLNCATYTNTRFFAW